MDNASYDWRQSNKTINSIWSRELQCTWRYSMQLQWVVWCIELWREEQIERDCRMGPLLTVDCLHLSLFATNGCNQGWDSCSTIFHWMHTTQNEGKAHNSRFGEEEEKNCSNFWGIGKVPPPKKRFFWRFLPNVGGWGGWFPNKVQTPQNPPNYPETFRSPKSHKTAKKCKNLQYIVQSGMDRIPYPNS